MDREEIERVGDELFEAMLARRVVEPLTGGYQGITVDDSYQISQRFLQRRLSSGEKVIGKKIGLTSLPVQRQLGVSQPDFGYLTDAMLFDESAEVAVSRLLIQPKAEGEIAFILGRDLTGPGVTGDDVLRATEYVAPCIEIVDSRIRNWEIRYQDTVADNASCGLVVLGRGRIDPRSVDLRLCGMVVEIEGEVVATGAGAAALGSPLNSVAWLANALARYGSGLKEGEVVLSGSLVPLLPAIPGTHMRVSIGGIGTANVQFS